MNNTMNNPNPTTATPSTNDSQKDKKRITELESTVKELTTERATQEAAWKDEHLAQEAELQACEQSKRELEGKLAAHEAELQAMLEANKRLESAVAKLNADHDKRTRAASTTHRKRKKELDDTSRELKRTEHQLANARAENASHKEEAQVAADQLAQCKNALADAKASLDQHKNTAANDPNGHNAKLIEDLKAKEESLKVELEIANGRAGDYDSKVQLLNAANENVESMNNLIEKLRESQAELECSESVWKYLTHNTERVAQSTQMEVSLNQDGEEYARQPAGPNYLVSKDESSIQHVQKILNALVELGCQEHCQDQTRRNNTVRLGHARQKTRKPGQNGIPVVKSDLKATGIKFVLPSEHRLDSMNSNRIPILNDLHDWGKTLLPGRPTREECLRAAVRQFAVDVYYKEKLTWSELDGAERERLELLIDYKTCSIIMVHGNRTDALYGHNASGLASNGHFLRVTDGNGTRFGIGYYFATCLLKAMDYSRVATERLNGSNHEGCCSTGHFLAPVMLAWITAAAPKYVHHEIQHCQNADGRFSNDNWTFAQPPRAPSHVIGGTYRGTSPKHTQIHRELVILSNGRYEEQSKWRPMCSLQLSMADKLDVYSKCMHKLTQPTAIVPAPVEGNIAD